MGRCIVSPVDEMRSPPSFKVLSLLILVLCAACHTNRIYANDDINSIEKKTMNKTFFVSEIFQKYGNRDYMTYEGFEHLLENLGLGQLKFDISHDVSIHKINGTFKEFHDELKLHKHNHVEDEASTMVPDGRRIVKRNLGELGRRSSASREKRCLTPEDLLAAYGLETSHSVIISKKGFVDMCPAIVYELDQKSCRLELPKHEIPAQGDEYHLVWIYASLSILVMSIAGFLCITVVPVITHSCYQSLLEFLIAAGVGTLCGDALLHLLPHVLAHRPDVESKSQPILRGTFALFSVFLFFIIEKVLKFVQNHKPIKSTAFEESGKMIMRYEGIGSKHSDSHHHSHGIGDNNAVTSMVIIGDILHNITDGLSIGAAFSSSISSGLASSIAILSHELPHELGDYAALLSNGMSKKKALMYNVVSSIFSFVGMVLGVLLGELHHASLWINAFTAGSFLYIALSDLVPEMKTSLAGKNQIKNTLTQICGLTSGSFIMLCVALFEDDLEKLIH